MLIRGCLIWHRLFFGLVRVVGMRYHLYKPFFFLVIFISAIRLHHLNSKIGLKHVKLFLILHIYLYFYLLCKQTQMSEKTDTCDQAGSTFAEHCRWRSWRDVFAFVISFWKQITPIFYENNQNLRLLVTFETSEIPEHKIYRKLLN